MAARVQNQSNQQLLSLAEAADRLRVCTRTVRNMVKRGRFPSAFLLESRGWRVPASDLDDYIASRRVGTQALSA